jgi:hypothetical protein
MDHNHVIKIFSCRGSHYLAEKIAKALKLDLGKIILKVTGKNLVIDSYIYEQVDLKGEIVSVEFMN